MKVSYKILKEYIDIDLSPKELGDELTMRGIVVDSAWWVDDEIKNVIVGKIEKVEPLPRSQNLLLVKVNIGDRVVDVVTGAPNVKEGDLSPIALPGATLPFGKKVGEEKIRGIVSHGFLCSPLELAREGEYGIMKLPSSAKPGEDVRPYLGESDYVYDFEITSNRPDLFNIIGIAREISAITSEKIRLPKPKLIETGPNIEELIKVEIVDKDLCKRYGGRVVSGIKIKESPYWLQLKLLLMGQRPINNIVDITNFVMLELGEPLHAFDLDLIAGRKILVRRAREDEKIVTLDDIERDLNSEILLIADQEKPVALAGVMGGANSEINDNTRNIFIEAAYFDPANNRRTTKFLGLRTEASLRFEKGLDPEMIPLALDRSAALVGDLAGGEIAKGKIDIDHTTKEKLTIKMNPDRVNKFLNLELSEDYMQGILEKLGFGVEVRDKNFSVEVPTFRKNDVTREVDLAEEIARIYGYDKIPLKLPGNLVDQRSKSRKEALKEEVRHMLYGMGFSEVITYSFVSPSFLKILRLTDDESDYSKVVKIKNPLNEDQSIMRTTLIPSLLDVLKYNYSRKQKKVLIFEIAKTYFAIENEEGLPMERDYLTGIMFRAKDIKDLWEKGKIYDYYDVKGVIEGLLNALNIKRYEFKPLEIEFLHPYRGATLEVEREKVGILGELHPEIGSELGIDDRIGIFELDIEKLLSKVKSFVIYKKLPRYPGVYRDIAFLIREGILISEVNDVFRSFSDPLLKDYKIFDIYKGEGIEPGYKSLAYSLFFQAVDRTLTDEDVDKIMDELRLYLRDRLGAIFRGQ